MDWYSRYIVSWELHDSLEGAFVLAAVGQAVETATPGIINSDQGSQYTDLDYVNIVLSAGVRISMDGKGRAIDNVFTERFWRSLKYEEVYPKEYVMPREGPRGNQPLHRLLQQKAAASVTRLSNTGRRLFCRRHSTHAVRSYPQAITGRGYE